MGQKLKCMSMSDFMLINWVALFLDMAYDVYSRNSIADKRLVLHCGLS